MWSQFIVTVSMSLSPRSSNSFTSVAKLVVNCFNCLLVKYSASAVDCNVCSVNVRQVRRCLLTNITAQFSSVIGDYAQGYVSS